MHLLLIELPTSYPQFATLHQIRARLLEIPATLHQIRARLLEIPATLHQIRARLQISGFKNARETWLRGRCFFP